MKTKKLRSFPILLALPAAVVFIVIVTAGQVPNSYASAPLVTGWLWLDEWPRDEKGVYRDFDEVLLPVAHISETGALELDFTYDYTETSVRDKMKTAKLEGHAGETFLTIAAGTGGWKVIKFKDANDVCVKPLAPYLNNDLADAVLKLFDKFKADNVELADGVDLDIENFCDSDWAAYVAWIKVLSGKLKGRNKKLSVTLQLSHFQYYSEIAQAADDFRIMAYDNHGCWSEPGPVSGAKWMRDQIQAALNSKVPKSKLIVGIPSYGYWWGKKENGDKECSAVLLSGGNKKDELFEQAGWIELDGKKLERDQRNEVAAGRKVSIKLSFLTGDESGCSTKAAVCWDPTEKVPHFKYKTENGAPREVWYENALSMANYLALAREFGVKGISIWRLGTEDPDVWEYMKRYKAGSLDAVTDPGAEDLRVVIEGSSPLGPISISGCTNDWSCNWDIDPELEGREVTIRAKIYQGRPDPIVMERKVQVVASQKAGMADIPAGEFWMGCSPGDKECEDDEKPRVRVFLEGFRIDKYEVTQGEYEQAMGSNPSSFKGCDRCPVEMVSWDEARAYCMKAGKRLPTEAEWEKAARGGADTAYYWGAGIDGAYGWYDGNSGKMTHPVGRKAPNGYGLYDMLGNVEEWVADCYDEGWYGRLSLGTKNPVNNCAGSVPRVLRGGSWAAYARYLRGSYRYGDFPGNRHRTLGFRCADN